MAMAFQLSKGAINQILNGEILVEPILQILRCKQISCITSEIILSDGINQYPYCLLGSELVDLVNREVDDLAVVCIKNYRYICITDTTDKIVIIVLDMTVIENGRDVYEIIGTPVESSSHHSRSPSLTTRFGAPSIGSDCMIKPVKSLTCCSINWIRVRVTHKTNILTWLNNSTEEKYFRIDLRDESGEIEAVAFKDECNKFYNNIHENEIYYIFEASVENAKRQYSSLKNDHQLIFTRETRVIFCSDINTSIPRKAMYHFKAIKYLKSGKAIDFIGVCTGYGDIKQITKRNGQETILREIKLMDSSYEELYLTLWDTTAESFNGSGYPVLAMRGCRLSDYPPHIHISSLKINPDIPEAHSMRDWYDHEILNK